MRLMLAAAMAAFRGFPRRRRRRWSAASISSRASQAAATATRRKGPNGPVMSRPCRAGHRWSRASCSSPSPPTSRQIRETGLGRYTDAQLKVMIREGKRPDGSLIGPPMPFNFYRGMADADLDAIIA